MNIEGSNNPALTEEDMEYICDSLCRWPYECSEEKLQEYCDQCRIVNKLEDKQ